MVYDGFCNLGSLSEFLGIPIALIFFPGLIFVRKPHNQASALLPN